MPKLNIPKVLALSLGVLALIFSLNYLVMAVWTEPGVAPPGANVPAPINTGNISQVKLGGLGISGSFAADGGAAAGMGLNVINGNVSIGTSTTSAFPLSFSRIVGNKIALWDGGSPDLCYGLGIAPGLMQIFSSYPGRLGIGYASTSSFIEILTVKGPNVGIGIIPSSTSTYKLDVSGKINASGTISGVATPVNGTDAANKDYVDAAGGGTYSSCYVLNSNTTGQTCAAGYTSLAWKNASGLWSFEPTIYGSFNTNATFITIGGQMLQVTFDGTSATVSPPGPIVSSILTWDSLSNNFTSPTYNNTGCTLYPNGVAMKLRMTINGVSYSGNSKTCDANNSYWNGSLCYTSNGAYCNNVNQYVTAGSFALCCK